MAADFIAAGEPLRYHQREMAYFRQRLAIRMELGSLVLEERGQGQRRA
jgi:hypothetical protein